ncbi:malto-oligosyltrehalose trehalohydrolase [Agrobacterium vitis]|uniref:Malto-oligosyltrehalose trehalohydrolase n=1 Tax=Agrobacterium vitis TaxID=373 RepID=A0ABD6G7I3_AGRVI|nr:malto-oligosyltrehalose trehalohydrolase [Agrobacterium vitis]MUO78731.1 malto-oligosyltrehalose trehalohydrolase [Agrobacterium vitis]MUO95066.1 malto-oligosyltrehalose trehalohydrolase [Agrobacterium vitis]MUP05143.1 malto-oligosyltrehalose trehalohydrolase [Agrobacterium vitis]MUZ81889.1 malto-oligosyltrehalose trehalohydrolase [Agrobacterium vitis]MVA09621.1 malto-oligosyltrehalose trehalohydrolase [Agrobacterium vitis]
MQDMIFGPVLTDNGTIFSFWAPLQEKVLLKIEGQEPRAMTTGENGWHSIEVPEVGAGCRYNFILEDGLAVPDPASRFQPDDVHGPSEVIDPAYAWQQTQWQGLPWEDIVIYELHVGSFTPAGTFSAIIERLDHLKNLGVTALQLMPINDFPGRWNWGYDGVLSYAPDSSYGRPEDLKRLVDEAHARGICVFLDVVYNHFGPDGNYLPTYAPIFTDKHITPWGAGINYDGDQSEAVREFVVRNAIYWVEEFRVDGLRFDAVHAIEDERKPHILHDIARRTRACAPGRAVHLIVENEDNNADLLERNENGAPIHFTAQWNDDIHHVLHIAATGENFGYYQDYADDASKLGRALAEGFVYQGEHMPYSGKQRGMPSTHLPPTAFISFVQNHDQIGNRAMGDRMAASQPKEALKALAAVYLLAPQIPMLFMGEEWGAKTPFPFFCDFNEELNEAVRQGRRKELSRLPGFDAEDASDPTAQTTFNSAKLSWKPDQQDGDILKFYRELLALRKEKITPLLRDTRGHVASHSSQGPVITVRWTLSEHVLTLTANLSAEDVKKPVKASGDCFFTFGAQPDNQLGPWAVVWHIGSR